VITLVIGGVRSGKSAVAERLAARAGEPVTVVVPASPDADRDFAARIREHQARRPADWRTCECGPALTDALDTIRGPALVDSLGSWVAVSPDLSVDAPALAAALRRRDAPTIVVTEEVGLAVHPPTEAGRRFADTLGEVNLAVADAADEAFLVVAGRVLPLVREVR
jgi:adenosyl cobinamide kinase/adenosyl cobinamide phosphate guanylyltransferase